MVFFLLVALFVAYSSCTSSPPYWTQITQSGAIPAPLSDGAGTYSSSLGFYVYGGLNGSYPNDFPVADLHYFNVDTLTWTDLSSFTGGPSARAEVLMWPTDSGFGLAGGRGPFRRGLDLTYRETYQFVHNGGWVYLGESQHANRSTEAATFVDEGTFTAYAFSGSSSTLSAFVNRDGGLRLNTVKYTPAGGWEAITLKNNSPSPTPRAHHCLISNHNGNSLFTYGGYTKDQTGGSSTFGESNYLGDLWEFKTNSKKWIQHTFSTTAPNPGKRDNGKLVFDQHNNRLWLVGGSNWETAIMDLWYYSFNTATWTNATSYLVDAVQPAARQGSLFFERSVNGAIEFWLFSGSSGEFGTPSNDMWRLTLPLDFSV